MKLSFVTPTAIDLREIFTLGLGSKRGDASKIGHKGSGLKFTLALLMRLGSALRVDVDGRTWHSRIDDAEIRGAHHQLIALVDDDNGEVRETNIAVTAGADTWVESWFALRELLQNTLDEGGAVHEAADVHAPVAGGTVLSIDLTEPLARAWQERSQWFHARHPEIIYAGGTPGLFFHGFRVFTEPKWRFCYDVTQFLSRDHLSEDRQTRNVNLHDLFARIVRECVFPAALYENMLEVQPAADIEAILQAVHLEIRHDRTDYGGFRLTDLEDAFLRRFGERNAFTYDKTERDDYYASAAGYATTLVNYRLSRILSYSKRIKASSSLLPELSARLTRVPKSNVPLDARDRLKRALQLTRSLRPEGCEVHVVEPDRFDAPNAGALALRDERKVYLLRSHAENATVPELVATLVEEFIHVSSGGDDASMTMQRGLVHALAQRLLPKERPSLQTSF